VRVETLKHTPAGVAAVFASGGQLWKQEHGRILSSEGPSFLIDEKSCTRIVYFEIRVCACGVLASLDTLR